MKYYSSFLLATFLYPLYTYMRAFIEGGLSMGNYVNLKEKAYELIKNKIINLEFMPGDYLEEKKLSELLAVSRTPIREALARLEAEMWVTTMPRKGIFVTQVDENMLNNIFEARKNFEPAILGMAFNNLSTIKLNIFKERFTTYDTLSQEERDKLDNDFHLYILNSVDNFFVKSMMVTTFEHVMRVRKLSFDKKINKRISDSNEEHINVINLILEGKKDEAMEAIGRHIENSYIYYLGLLF